MGATWSRPGGATERSVSRTRLGHPTGGALPSAGRCASSGRLAGFWAGRVGTAERAWAHADSLAAGAAHREHLQHVRVVVADGQRRDVAVHVEQCVAWGESETARRPAQRATTQARRHAPSASTT